MQCGWGAKRVCLLYDSRSAYLLLYWRTLMKTHFKPIFVVTLMLALGSTLALAQGKKLRNSKKNKTKSPEKGAQKPVEAAATTKETASEEANKDPLANIK